MFVLDLVLLWYLILLLFFMRVFFIYNQSSYWLQVIFSFWKLYLIGLWYPVLCIHHECPLMGWCLSAGKHSQPPYHRTWLLLSGLICFFVELMHHLLRKLFKSSDSHLKSDNSWSSVSVSSIIFLNVFYIHTLIGFSCFINISSLKLQTKSNITTINQL